MDEEPNVVYHLPNYKRLLSNKPFIITLFLLVLSWFLLIFYFFSSINFLNLGKSSNLPISLNLLQNPIVYEWRGDVTGKLVKINPDSFVLQDDKGNNITIFYWKWKAPSPKEGNIATVFSKLEGGQWKDITIDTIPINSTLRGDFFIFKSDLKTPFGSSFTVVK